MEEAVVGAFVGATIQVVLQNLLSSSMEEIGLIWNFKKDLQKLKKSLLLIQDFLEDAETKQVTDKSVRRWLMNLEAVAFDADHVFDQLNYQLLRRKVQISSSKLKKEVRYFFPNFTSLAFRHKMARKIKGIKNELKSINQEATELGLQMRIATSHARGTGADALTYLETDSFSVDPVFIGRENDVAKIVEMVISSPTEEVVSVLPIVGMGGVGKTTLTRKVYNDARIFSHFEKHIWVHVSHDYFDSLSVLKKIVASSTKGENVDGQSREVVLQKIHKSLGDKKYLLVLDNVWNEDNDKWENFMSSLKGISSVKGNVIIVTSRSLKVANIVKTLNIHELGILSEQDCWLIIKSKVSGGEDIPSMFETIGEHIALRCGGLPLAAQVVGGMLRGKTEHEWVSIEKSFLLSFGGDGNIVSKILKLSFDHLSSPLLKKCFAFCSMIPKGWWMEKDELIHYWMAEGLLHTDQDIDMEIVGNNVVNILVQRSLLQVQKRDRYGDIERCILHELVYDLASSILNSQFLDGAQQVRYVCSSFIDESCSISKEHAKCLRALFGKISNTVFSNLTCIHVLCLNDDEMKELPNEMGKLISLRFLDISLTSVECLPDSIGDLYHLQTLRATEEYGGESNLKKLPDTLKFLISLRHLYIPNIKLPPHIGKLTSLQTLPYFQVGDEEGCRIIELGSLKKLKGAIEIHNLEKLRDKEEAETADLFHKNIRRLKIVWNEPRKDDQNNDENVLEGLQPNWNLESLNIKGFKGSNFPSWTMRMEVREDVGNRWIRLDNLLEIELSDCEECEEIPTMGQLPRLKYLYLRHLSKVKCMSFSFYGKKEDDDVNEEMVFPTLERLELTDMENLTTWAEVKLWRTQLGEVLVFPRLEYLKIVNCWQLESAPSHFPCLKELEIDNMESGTPLANICGSNLTSLTNLKLRKVDGMACLPNGFFSRNQHLIELEIRDCNNLSYLVQCSGDGGAFLRKLIIIDCRNLKSIGSRGLSSQSFTSLRILELAFCRELTNLPLGMIESCAMSLEILNLTRSESITNLPQVMRFVHKNCRLIELGIAGVPKLHDVVAEIGSLRSLQLLTIGGSSDCLDYNSFNAILDCIFPVLQSLRHLYLHGMEEWDALPEQLQHLTTLHTLGLSRFGVEAVPEWLERLSSLRYLQLVDFPKLSSLPSKKAMQRLTTLRIIRCPILKQNLEGESARDDSEWSKVSHIPNILVDDPSGFIMKCFQLSNFVISEIFFALQGSKGQPVFHKTIIYANFSYDSF